MTRKKKAAGRPPVADWNPQLAETLLQALYPEGTPPTRLEPDLEPLVLHHGDAVYSELIYLLCHLRFSPDEARAHWRKVTKHRDLMAERMKTPIDLRVALVSYFVQVNKLLKNPKIIELKLFEQTRASVYRDELTGLYNYRFFVECLSQEILRSDRLNAPLSLIMVDVDNFKAYNDREGHDAGSRTLAEIAWLLGSSLRKVDVASRYGGEEFALILPATAKINAVDVAERARQRVEAHVFDNESDQPLGKLTVSLGVATFPADAPDGEELIRRADRALYVAKHNGKNQIQPYGQNLRSYRRISATVDGTFCELAPDVHSFKTVNMSEGGMLLRCDKYLPVGSLIRVSLRLPERGQDVSALGRVVLTEEKDDGRFDVAIRLIEMATEDRKRLTQYVRSLAPDGTPLTASLNPV